jgi:hypothetical protein|tara:strand:+ start:435 stop:641 length:207 start_codon:yes stop_codon:yes gene_type:complete
MNNEVKEILSDLIDYYNTVGTKEDPGIHIFESLAKRASKVLARNRNTGVVRIDPFDIGEPPTKHEEEW